MPYIVNESRLMGTKYHSLQSINREFTHKADAIQFIREVLFRPSFFGCWHFAKPVNFIIDEFMPKRFELKEPIPIGALWWKKNFPKGIIVSREFLDNVPEKHKDKFVKFKWPEREPAWPTDPEYWDYHYSDEEIENEMDYFIEMLKTSDVVGVSDAD